MSYGVTPKGWVSKPQSKILENVAEKAKKQWGDSFPTTPESVFGQLSNIFASASKENWDMAEGVASMQNRTTAEGLYLDYLARLAGLTRQAARGSSGLLVFSGRVNTTVPIFTVCKDALNRKVLTQRTVVLNRASCYNSTFKIRTAQDNTDYTLVVGGKTTTFNSGSSSTIEKILKGLQSGVQSTTSVSVQIDVPEGTITLTYGSFNNNLRTTNSANITLQAVGALASAESALTGASVNFSKGSVNQLVTSILAIDSVTNVEAFQNGRDLETDEELRLRMDQREESAGTATKPSIETAVSEVKGVVYSLVEVNDTLNDDPTTGIPAKHFETYVTGGDDLEIAKIIWKTKSLFGQTHGTINKEIIDENGKTQSVKFSRPVEYYAWLEVRYSLNPEETFPADGENALKEAVVTYGKRMPKGQDLAPTKFYGALYTVQGVYIEEVKVAMTLPDGTPAYQSSKIPVSPVQNLLFDPSRVIITT